jgi:hypothetical protein
VCVCLYIYIYIYDNHWDSCGMSFTNIGDS